MAEKTINLSGKQIVDGLNQQKAQLDAIQRGMASIQGLIQELFFAKESIKAIKKTKKGEKSLIALGAGVFLEMKVDETTKVKRSIAGNILIDSKIDAALEELEKQEKEATEKLQQLYKQQESIQANMNTLTRIITEAQKARQEQAK